MTSLPHSHPSDYPEESAFHPDNVLPAILITLNRIYDIQMLLLRERNVQHADTLAAMHKEGTLLAPPPAFGVDIDE